MVIRKRNENKILVEDVGIKNENSLIPTLPKFNNIEIKTWAEESKEVLDILEKEQGIYIYDEDRYGGMYLKNSKKSSPTVRKLFNQPNNEIENSKKLDNLFGFFNKNKSNK